LTVVSIDPELRDICLPLSADEKQILRELLIAEGCRDPIIAWNAPGNPILDGHHRYEICNGEGIPYEVKLIDLADRQACIDWVIKLQLGRRNVPEEQKAYLRGKMYREAKKAEGRPPKEKLGQSDPVSTQPVKPKEDTATKIAKLTDSSAATVKRDERFTDAVDALKEKSPELARAARVGNIPKSSIPTLANAPQSTIDRLAAKAGNPSELRTATKKVVDALQNKPSKNGKSHVREKDATPADAAKAQIKIWADTIGRWLGQSPSIDELRGKFPGKQGDAVVTAATGLYESLKTWQKAIK